MDGEVETDQNRNEEKIIHEKELEVSEETERNSDENGEKMETDIKSDNEKLENKEDVSSKEETKSESMDTSVDNEIKVEQKDVEMKDIDESVTSSHGEEDKTDSSNGKIDKEEKLDDAVPAPEGKVEKEKADGVKIDVKTDDKRSIYGGVINVSEGLLKRTQYVRCTKPYSRLDHLLERRLKQADLEQKQKLAIQQVLNKHKSIKEKGESAGKKTREVKLCGSYSCYSPLCVSGGLDCCYSVLCKFEKEKKSQETEDMDVDVTGDSEHKISLVEKPPEPKLPEIEHTPVKKEEKPTSVMIKTPGGKTIIAKAMTPLATMATPGTSTTAANERTTLASVMQGKVALSETMAEELTKKLKGLDRTTQQKMNLLKFTKGGKGSRSLIRYKKGGLPMCQKFNTRSHKKSLFILEYHDLRRLARNGGKIETPGFNYNCKMSNVMWPYPCPRPYFRTAWRYRTQGLQSLAAAAVQLRILWACIRWDDMAIKPPTNGTNSVTTETEITTTELLKRRDIGAYGLRSEFLVRKIIVPLNVPTQQKGK